jgi:exodeoxyribonuclease X
VIIRCIDFETTGLPTPEDTHAVVQVGWCDVDWNRDSATIGEPQSSLVRPGRPISLEAMAVHHIRDEDVADALSADAVLPNLMQGADAFCSHNIDMERTYFGGGEKPWICSYKSALRVWRDSPTHSNQVLRYFLKIDDDDDFDYRFARRPHRAPDDAYCTAFILRNLLGSASFDDLVRWSSGPALLLRVGFGKHAGLLWEEVPPDYLDWVVKNITDNRDVRATAKHYLNKHYAKKGAEKKREQSTAPELPY